MDRRKVKTQQTKQPPVIPGSDEKYLLEELENIARTLNIQVRTEKGDFTSSLCRLGKEHIMFLKKDEPVSKKVDVLARELALQNLENINIIPAVQKILDEAASVEKRHAH